MSLSNPPSASAFASELGVKVGEGAPVSLTEGLLYVQQTAGKSVAIWRGTATTPEQIADLTGTPANGSVTAEKIAENAVTATAIAKEAVEASEIATGAVTEGKLGAEAVATGKVKLLAITAALLAAEAVESGKIKDAAVTAAKLAENAVETAKIKENAVTSAKIGGSAVTETKINEGAVVESKLATAVKNKLLTLEASTALTTRAEATEFEPSATKATLVTGMFEGATLTRTKVKASVGGVVVFEGVISAANTGVSAQPFCFAVGAAAKWKWDKVEGTIEAFKTSYTVL